jgi:hypothetical protein
VPKYCGQSARNPARNAERQSSSRNPATTKLTTIKWILAHGGNINNGFHVRTIGSGKFLKGLCGHHVRDHQRDAGRHHDHGHRETERDGITDAQRHRPEAVAPAQQQVVARRA